MLETIRRGKVIRNWKNNFRSNVSQNIALISKYFHMFQTSCTLPVWMGESRLVSSSSSADQTSDSLTFQLLVANFANAKWCKQPEKWLNPWVLIGNYESYQMNTNIAEYRWLSNDFASLWVNTTRYRRGIHVH